jgi:hypothetical protein|nr:MAG TPA: DNA polymerase B [Caudoviricetes sp.]
MAKDPVVIGYADFETMNPKVYKKYGMKLVPDGNGIKVCYIDDPEEKPLQFHPHTAVRLGCIIKKNYKTGEVKEEYYYTLKDFLLNICDCDRVYFHNLRFDQSFIQSAYERANHTLILSPDVSIVSIENMMGNMGVMYRSTLKYEFKLEKRDPISHRRYRTKSVQLWDSAKIWTTSIENLGKTYGLVKGDKNGTVQALATEITREYVDYCFMDCKILMTAMEHYFDEVRKATDDTVKFGYITAASTSMNLYKYSMKDKLTERQFRQLFPTGDDIGFSELLRKTYKGGPQLMNPLLRYILLDNENTFDANSMHPTQMVKMPMPVGKEIPISPQELEDNDYKLKGMHWYGSCRIMATVKPEVGRGTYMTKNTRAYGTSLPTELRPEILEVLTDIDFEILARDYDIDYIEFEEVYAFKTMTGLFTNFIMYWYNKKAEAGAEGNKPLKAFCKLIINSFYGKWGTNPDRIETDYILNEDECLRVQDVTPDRTADEKVSQYYLPIAVWTTAYSRKLLDDACWAVGWEHIAYTDTDSIHVVGLDADVIEDRLHKAGIGTDGSELGDFKHESHSEKALYIRNKGYFHFNEDEFNGKISPISVKMAGCNKWDWKSIEDVVEDGRMKEGLVASSLMAFNIRGGKMLLEKQKEVTDNDRDCMRTKVKVNGQVIEEYYGGKLIWRKGEYCYGTG